MTKEIVRIVQAIDFAARKHVHQRRKGESAEPYINHLTEVARLLAEATEGKYPDLIIAGLLHDTIEDQDVTWAELAAEFGDDVANLVAEVTDDKSIDKAERKSLQVSKAPHKSNRAKLLKIADKTANLHSIISSPPAHWDLERKRTYFDWAKAVVDGCRGINLQLERDFDEAYRLKP